MKLVTAALLLIAALAGIARVPAVLHEAVDLERAERWSRDGRPDQAALLLTMLHRAHPQSTRIAVALARAQQRAGDLPAMEKTIEELRIRDQLPVGRARSDQGLAHPTREARQGAGL